MAWLLWGIRAMQGMLPHAFQPYALEPRSFHGLLGIATMPFLHVDASHLWHNLWPLLGLGWLVMWEGPRRFGWVTVQIALLGGACVWLFGSSHAAYMGCSGVVYGYLGYVLGRGWWLRAKPQWLFAAALAVFFFGGMIFSWIVWRAHVSMLAHVSGLLSGLVCAWLSFRRRIILESAAP